MKLHLPTGLLSALLACMAVVPSPYARAAEYTWLGQNSDIHGANNWDPSVTDWSAVWSGTAANTIILDQGSLTGTSKELQASFNTLSIGGITVTGGSDGFGVVKGGGYNRAINLRDGGQDIRCLTLAAILPWAVPARPGQTALSSMPMPCSR